MSTRIVFRVRVPVPWVILLSLLAIVLPGWFGMRNADFLTPPKESALVTTRIQTALPRLATQADAISPYERNAIAVEAPPQVQLGDISTQPALNEYADRADRGAAHLIELATRLEDEEHDARALLAWERVIDSADSNSLEMQAAIEAVSRLRPTLPPLDIGTGSAPAVTLQAGTGKKSAEAFEPVLQQAAAHLQRAASGVLRVTAKVNAGPDIDLEGGPVPVAVWISGAGEDSPSTDVRSFTVSTPETLEHDTLRTLFLLVKGHMRNIPGIKPPPAPHAEGDLRDVINTHITRLQWQKLGEHLNTPEKNEQTDE